MKLLSKLTIKNLKLNKKRTIVTIIGIILSVALITAVSTMYSSAVKSLINFETHEKGDYHVVFYDVPVGEINTFNNNRSIEKMYFTKDIGYAKLNDSKNEYKPYAYIKMLTKESLSNLSVKLVEGRLPNNDNEILIPTHLKTNGRMNLKVGGTITLNVGQRQREGIILNQNNPFVKELEEEIINTTEKTYKIVGLIERPSTSIEPYSAPGYTFITYAGLSDLTGNIDVFTRYTKKGEKDYLKVTANILEVDEEIFEKVSKNILNATEKEKQEVDKAKYKININNYLIMLETNLLSDSAISGLTVVVGIICFIIVFTSVFCIKNSFDISITEKTREYGMLKSIGATKKQIKQNVLYEGFILGLIAIPIGVLSGLIASYILIIVSNHFMTNLYNEEGLKLIFNISYISIIIAIIISIITIYLSAIRSAKKASKISPIDSIRNNNDIKIKSKNIKCPKLINKLFGIGGEISYKNIKRNKKKYRTTVISIFVSVVVFIALSSFMKLSFMTINSELEMQDYNLYLSIKIDNNENLYNKVLSVIELDNIEDYTIHRNKGFNFNNPKYNPKYLDILNITTTNESGYFNLSVLGEHQYKKYIKELGLKYEDIKDKAIINDTQTIYKYDKKNRETKTIVRKYNYTKGDTIKGITSNDKELEIEIGYVTDKDPMGLKNKSENMLIISDELYNKIISTNDNLTIYLDSNNPNKLQDDIDELLKDEEYNLNNISERVEMMQNLYTLLGIFLYGFIIVISLIGVTNIFNTITTNMELRKREFATLKSIGMTKKEFNRMIKLESIFMGTKSLLLGVIVGLILSYMIYKALAYSEGFAYPFPLLPILIAIVSVFLLISLIMKYSMNKINKQNTIETIRNENI